MADYAVHFKPSAYKELQKLNPRTADKILAKIEGLSNNPRPAGCKKLVHTDDLWRIRVGDYRVVYVVDAEGKSVEVMRIGHRREVYG